ncbi:MAG: ABC transporter permease, partial [Gemmatimonadetes bacterium]|nr:ABC transporter permease [Gemmatimonadota bacterium]
TADYFPTLFPSGGGFLIADLHALADYLDQRGSESGAYTEMFVRLDPALHAQAAQEIAGMFKLGRFEDREQLRGGALVDPLTAAGWRGVGVVALAVAVTSAVLGYLTYLRAYARRTRVESAFVRALGLSGSHYAGMLLVEHLLIGLFGVGLGVLSGLWVSRIAVASIAHTETGGELVPPFVLQTDWTPVVLMLGALAVTGAAALAGLVRAFVRAPLHDLTRAEE